MPMAFNEEYVVFHYELGAALAQWAFVEHALAGIAAQCVGPIEANTVTDGFFGIENFRSKREFVNRMLRQYAAELPDVIGAWDILNDRIAAGASVRNQLVHRTLQTYPEAREGRRYALVEFPEYYEEIRKSHSIAIVTGKVTKRKRRRSPSPDAMCLHQVVEAHSRFFGLWASLGNFSEMLRGNPKIFREADEQGYAVPDIRGLDSRFRAALGLPPRTSLRSRPAPGDAAAEAEKQKMAREAAG